MKSDGLVEFNEAVQNPGKKLNFAVHTELESEEDIDLLEPITGELNGVSTGNILLISGNFRTKLVTECARCGEPIELQFEFTMNDEFDVEGVPSCYGSDGYAEVVQDEPLPIFKKNALILDSYVRQGLLINMPAQPLCSGNWETPCPHQSESHTDALNAKGHPAMMQLEKFRSQDKA